MRILTFVFLSLILVGCGSESSTVDSNVTPTTQSIAGSYTITDISGSAWVQNQPTTLEAQDVSVAGRLDIDHQNFEYEITITAQGQPPTTETFLQEGTYSITYTNPPFEGAITLLSQSGTETRDFSLVDKEIF